MHGRWCCIDVDCVPSYIFWNISVRNQPIFITWCTHVCKHATIRAFCSSENSLGRCCNNWLFKMHPIFEESNGNLIRCIRSAFHKVYSGFQLWWTCYVTYVEIVQHSVYQNNSDHLTFDWVIHKIKGGRFYWDTVYSGFGYLSIMPFNYCWLIIVTFIQSKFCDIIIWHFRCYIVLFYVVLCCHCAK